MFPPRRDGWEVLDALCILITPDSCQTVIHLCLYLYPLLEEGLSL